MDTESSPGTYEPIAPPRLLDVRTQSVAKTWRFLNTWLTKS